MHGAAFPLTSGHLGEGHGPIDVVDLDAAASLTPTDLAAATAAAAVHPRPLVGVATSVLAPTVVALARASTLTLTVQDQGVWSVPVADPAAEAERLVGATAATPRAAAVLGQVVRLTAGLDLSAGVVVESLAYSTLLGGEEFRVWRATTPTRDVPPSRDAIRLSRHGDVLDIRIDRPARRNALDQAARQALAEALDVALADPCLQVRLAGEGQAFCAGGDLDEFGTATDLALAHEVRTVHGPAPRLARLASRTTAHVHGACVGAGVELAAFAGHVIAAPDTTFRLPEVTMGLIPGAGGTASITSRIGRWRTAWLALSGASIDAPQARAWGLVDAIGPADAPPEER